MQAPRAPVTINNGYVMSSWFDILNGDNNEFHYSFSDIQKNSLSVKEVIESEFKHLNDYQRIIIGGFSQGAILTTYLGLSY